MDDLFVKAKIRRIHLIGINGSSMSGLAEILLGMGYAVSGSDKETSRRLEDLKRLGARIYQGHHAGWMGRPDLVVYSAAIREDNTEYRKASRLGIPLMDRAVLLGKLMERYPYGVGVSGAHGKTTTTSMLGYLLMECGFDPTLHIGGEAFYLNSNVRMGSSPYFVTEADEYHGSFLQLSPYIGIILNIDYDHVDWYRDLEDMKQAFLAYALRIPKEGCLVACAHDPHAMEIYNQVCCRRVRYGIGDISLDYTALQITYDEEGYGSFDLYVKGRLVRRVRLSLRGRVNVLNALAAVAAAHLLGGDPDRISCALETMTGARRRMDLRGIVNQIRIFRDYAHHPTEIDITLETASHMAHREIWAVFEPHTFTRIQVLYREFTTCFSHSHHVIMADVYNDREPVPKNMNSRILAEGIATHHPDAIYLPSYQSITDHLALHAKPGDIVMILGSKTIVKVADMLFDVLSRAHPVPSATGQEISGVSSTTEK